MRPGTHTDCSYRWLLRTACLLLVLRFVGGVNQAARLKLLLKNRIRRTRLGLGLKMKLAELPTAQRMDPLLIRTLYESEKRVAPATVALCDKLRNTNRYPHGTGLTKIDIDFLAHVTVATPSPQGPKSKMLCIGFTYKEDHATKVGAMVSTWMPRCDGAVMLSNEGNATLPTVEVPHIGEEAYANIWQKSRANWKYVYDNYFDEYDWFVFGGTDYFVIVENMRLYLESDEIKSLNDNGTPLYIGRRFSTDGKKDQGLFNSGGPSYVLNKVALKLFIDNVETSLCRPNAHTHSEDVLIADCLRHSGNVLPYDTRDEKRRERFHPFAPGFAMFHTIDDQAALKAKGEKLPWYTKYSAWGEQTGLDCCNPHSISWHYSTPATLRSLDSIFYACRTPAMMKHFERNNMVGLNQSFEKMGKIIQQRAKVKAELPALGKSRPTEVDLLRKTFDEKVAKLQAKRDLRREVARDPDPVA